MVLRQPVDAKEAVGSGSSMVMSHAMSSHHLHSLISMNDHNDHHQCEEGHDETSEQFPSKDVSVQHKAPRCWEHLPSLRLENPGIL